MVCIQCGHKTQIVNSRLQKRSNTTWRRRQCSACGSVFTTLERADYANAWVVQSGDGIRPFLRDKLLISIYQGLQHRPTAITDAGDLVDTVIQKLAPSNGSLSSGQIREIVLVTLNRFDAVASTHYAAFHRG